MIPTMPFGQTGHCSSRLIFGGFAVGFITQAEADRVLDLLLEHGINHIDTAPSYGEAEDRIGAWMRRHRDDFFLATKIDQRGYADATHQIQHSLERLQTDRIDLIQLHNLVDSDEWRMALGPDGALEAAVEAHEKGYVRFIGVTGHGVTVAERHQLSLGRFPFDSVLLPFNYSFMQDPDYRKDFEALRTVCGDRGVAVQTIKALASGRWEGRHQTHQTWYKPLSRQEDVDAAVHYVLARPDLFLNTSGDPTLLPKIIDAAERFDPEADLDALEAHLAARDLRPLFMETDRI